MALHAKKLPMVSSEAQARVLAPWIRNRNFLKKVTALLNGRDTFPVTSQMAEQLGSSGTRPSTKAAKWRAAIRACDQLLGGRVLDKADVVVIGALRAQFVRRRDRVTPKGSQQMELGPLFDAGAASSGKLPSVPAAPAP